VVLKEKNLVLTRSTTASRSRPSGSSRTTAGTRSACVPRRRHVEAAARGPARGEERPARGRAGTLLDLDKGTYPFVTSSNPVAGYALASAGIGPREVEAVIGVTKAYVTRVGAGPFPTEDLGPDGDRMGERGHVRDDDRPQAPLRLVRRRRPALRSPRERLTELFLTKLDVLSGFPDDQGLHRVSGRRRAVRGLPPHQSLFTAPSPCGRSSRAGPRSSTRCGRSTTSRARRGRTSRGSTSSAASRSRWSPSVRARAEPGRGMKASSSAAAGVSTPSPGGSCATRT